MMPRPDLGAFDAEFGPTNSKQSLHSWIRELGHDGLDTRLVGFHIAETVIEVEFV